MKSMSGLISFLLLTTAFGVIAGVQSLHLDFPLTDGAYYFDRAHLFATSGIRPDREWSPLFVIGYGIHHWIFPSGHPLLLYLTHRLLVLYAVVLLFWVLSRRLFPEPLALLLSLGFLGHGTLLFDYPVVHVAGVGVILVLLLGTFSPRTPGMLPILLGLSFLGIWVRLENLAVLAALGILVLKKVLTHRRQLGGIQAWGTLAICLLISLAVSALSYRTTGSNRSFEAFSQCFAWSEIQASGGSLRSGHLDYAQRVEEVFGEADSITEATLANPRAFLGHVAGNVPGLLKESLWVFLPGPDRSPWVPLLFLLLLFVFLQPGTSVPTTSLFWVISGAGGVASLAVGLVLEPSPHYLLPATPLVMVAGTLLLKKGREALPDWKQFSRAGGRLHLAVIVAACAVLTFFLIPRGPHREKQVAKLSEALAVEAPDLGTIRVQAFSSLSYCAYLRAKGHRCQEVAVEPTRNATELSAFLRVEEINALVVDDFLRQFYEDSNSAVLREFEAAPQRFGFEARLEAEGDFLGKATLYVQGGSVD